MKLPLIDAAIDFKRRVFDPPAKPGSPPCRDADARRARTSRHRTRSTEALEFMPAQVSLGAGTTVIGSAPP